MVGGRRRSLQALMPGFVLHSKGAMLRGILGVRRRSKLPMLDGMAFATSDAWMLTDGDRPARR